MARKEIIHLYPPSEEVPMYGEIDNDPPVKENIEIHILPSAFVNYFGYVFYKGRPYSHFISPRHRTSVGLSNSISTYFRKKRVYVDRPVISIANGWFESYYHFTLEVLVKVFLLRDYLEHATLIFPENTLPFHQQWFELLGIKDVYYIKEDEVVVAPKVISSNFPNRDLNHHNRITPLFRSWLLERSINSTPILIQQPFRKIFINRRPKSIRHILNVSELVPKLKEAGFDEVFLEDFNVRDQIELFHHAQTILAIHGAGLANMLFCNSGTRILDIMHEEFNQLCFYKLSHTLGLNYRKIKATGGDPNLLPGYRDLIVDPLSLMSEL